MLPRTLTIRYIMLGVVLVCNAITASVAAWRFGLIRAVSESYHSTLYGTSDGVDVYVMSISALSLVFSFVIILADVVNEHGLMNRIWFECLWAAIMGLLDFISAIWLSVTTTAGIEGDQVALHVLIAFTWILEFCLCTYLKCFGTSVIIYYRANSERNPWNKTLKNYDWRNPIREKIQDMRINSQSPCLDKIESVLSRNYHEFRATPLPQARTAPTRNRLGRVLSSRYFHRAGLGSEYEIEHFPSMFREIIQGEIPLPVPEVSHDLSPRNRPSLYMDLHRPSLSTIGFRDTDDDSTGDVLTALIPDLLPPPPLPVLTNSSPQPPLPSLTPVTAAQTGKSAPPPPPSLFKFPSQGPTKTDQRQPPPTSFRPVGMGGEQQNASGPPSQHGRRGSSTTLQNGNARKPSGPRPRTGSMGSMNSITNGESKPV